MAIANPVESHQDQQHKALQPLQVFDNNNSFIHTALIEVGSFNLLGFFITNCRPAATAVNYLAACCYELLTGTGTSSSAVGRPPPATAVR